MFKIKILKDGVEVGEIRLAQNNMTFGDLKKLKEVLNIELKGEFIKEIKWQK